MVLFELDNLLGLRGVFLALWLILFSPWHTAHY